MRQTAGRGEIRRAVGAGNLQAVLDVLADLAVAERMKMVADGDALAQLAQAVLVESVAQFGLAHQDDLQQLALVGFEIGKEADLFEQFAREVLGLVNNKNGVLAALGLMEEEAVDFGHRFQAVQALGLQAQFHGDGLDELVGVEHGIENERGGELGAELFEQARQRVVLPAPTSPVNWTKPLRSRMP